MSNYYIFLIIFLLCLYIPYLRRKKFHRRQIKKRNRKGEKLMAAKMIEECIGKKVSIFIDGELTSFVATILAVEENFIKVEDKKTIRYINADMVHQIMIKKEQE